MLKKNQLEEYSGSLDQYTGDQALFSFVVKNPKLLAI